MENKKENEVRVSADHKNHEQLHRELEEAKKKIMLGGFYSHYKYPENHYKVLRLGFIESTDHVAVIYQAEYDPKLVFVRPLDSWLEHLGEGDKKIDRFNLIK